MISRAGGGWRPAPLLIAWLVALAFSLATPRAALAHAELVGSEPVDGAALQAAPRTVRLYFSEPSEREFFSLEVYSARRVRVDRNDARIPADDVQGLEVRLDELERGVYTVVWRVLSIDGHVVRGVIAFSVGVVGPAAGTAVLPPGLEVGGAPFLLAAGVRWLTYGAAMALLGGFMFGVLILRPALAEAGASRERAWAAASRRLLWVLWPAVAALLVLTLLALVVQAADASGQTLSEVLSGRAVTRLLTGTKYGALWLGRAAHAAALLFMVVLVAAGRGWGLGPRWLGAGTAAGLLLVLAATGHASAVPRRTALAVGVDWAHMVAAGVWVGGLAQMLIGLPAALGVMNAHTRRIALGRAVRRFSALAAVCVFLVVVTGTFSATLHVPTWEALAETFYGVALTSKLLLVAPLLLFGAVNLLVMHPRFVRAWRAAAPGAVSGADDVVGRRWFRRVVGVELLIGVLVLGATGILSGLPPATSAPGVGRPATETARAGDLSVTLNVDPNQAGTNTFRAEVTDAQGRPAQMARVTLALSHVDMEMGVREVEMVNVGGNRYEAVGGYATMAGRWQLQVRLRRAAAPSPEAEVTATVNVTVGQPAGTARPLISPARVLAMSWTPALWLALVVLALAGFMAWLLVTPRRTGRLRRRERRLLEGAVWALMLAGLFVGGREIGDGYRASVAVAMPLVNPIAPSPESIGRGQLMFAQCCVVCLGVLGRGAGPLARTLRPPPADLRTHVEAGHTDAQLFGFISAGVPGTAMPAWREQLTTEQRWELVNYVKTFGGTP